MRLLFLICLYAISVFGESPYGPVTDEQYIRSKYLQLGLSGGTPAGINFCAGYWLGPTHDNWIVQFCGMHYGSTLNGLQMDAGRAFYVKKKFKAFWMGSMRRSHIDLAGTPVDFFGIGPTVGMNWNSFDLELGLFLGKGTNTKFFPYQKDADAGSRFTIQAGIQLGIKKLFWQ